ncbi:MAG: hypothetical protein E7436_00085 [Ruminococcaceae bacterium]|nr:hypothetical protein [Oscillospiraceae bacterium]
MNVTMKKILALVLSLACVIGLFAGCTPVEPDPTETQPQATDAKPTDPTVAPTDPTAAPTDPTAAPTDPTVTPTDPTVPPTDPTVVPTEPTVPPTEPTVEPTEPATKPTEPKPAVDYYEHSQGKTFQNMSYTFEELPKAFNVASTYTVQDLGLMQFEDYPIDGVYDNAFNCIKVGDTYKMWWCRACPFDTIWYAESKDMKNWYNEQMVIDLYGYSSKYMHSMLSWPSVLYVDGKYHMFFEAPGKEDEVGEYSNSIFYAMSKDGINWTFYPDNKNPQPVIKDPTPAGQRSYGVGQPKAFYMDGYFYVTYVDATTSGGNVRIARSKGNGYSFEGEVYDHPMLLEGGAGAAIRYNSVTNKYYFMITASETQSNGVYNDTLFIMESEDLYSWPYKTGAQLRAKGARLSLASDVMKKANIDLVTNEHGIVDTENMILMWMEGTMPSASEDHRNTHTTWEGRIAVIGVGSKYNKTLTLPNGKTCNTKNMAWYQDQVWTWVRPTVEVVNGTPTIDGTKDSVYNKSETVLIETVTWSYEYSKPTNTTGKVNAVWDNDALYVYAEIMDSTGPYTGYNLEKPGNLWRNDGITVFIDVMDTKTGTNNYETLTPLSFMVTIDASGTLVVKDSGENVCTEEFAGYQVKTKKISGGYVIEAKIPWYSMVQGMVKEGKTIGCDFQINDSFNDTVGRQAQVYWSDYTGDSFLYLDRWGQLILK